MISYKQFLRKISIFLKDKPRLNSFFHRVRVRAYRIEGIIPDEVYAKWMYKKHTGKKLNLDEPKSFNEKLWWLKFNYHNPLETTCSDKYRVREYVAQKGYGANLCKLYGVFDRPEDVDFEKFENDVFIKCNHGSGTNVIYAKGKPFDKKRFIKNFRFDLSHNHYYVAREWNYKNIKPCILCEEVLKDEEGNLPLDYKFMCFNGVPKLLFLEGNVCRADGLRNTSNDRYVNIYDMDFHLLPVKSGRANENDSFIPVPKTFDFMKKMAADLSQPFPHCRVDLYSINNNVYFGEITFYHGAACNAIEPEEFAIKMGEWIDTSKIGKRYDR